MDKTMTAVKIEATWTAGMNAHKASELTHEMKSFDYHSGNTHFANMIRRAELIENGAYGSKPAVYTNVTNAELEVLLSAAHPNGRGCFTVKIN
jgi:hypothetical protein